MKRSKILVVALLIAVTLTALCFVACTDGKGKGDVTVVIACDGSNAEYYVAAKDVEGEGVLAVLEYLKEKKGLNVKYETSSYGAYLTEVGNFVNGTDEKYIYIFTSVEKDQDVSEYRQSVEYNGKTLINSGVGVEGMNVEEDAVIYIGLYQ